MLEDIERLARHEIRLENLEDDMRAVMQELGGVAHGGQHVRARLHSLENGQAALHLVEQAVREVQADRRERAKEKRSIVSGWLGVLIVVFAGIGALGTVVAVITALFGGGG